MVAISTELQKARQNLLDLTMRNRLLNYRQTAMRSIRVVGELPAEMYDALVLREKTLEFRGTGLRKRSADGLQAMDADADDPLASPRESDEWRARDATQLEARHTDRYLQTPYDDESLGKKLFRVYHEGRSAVEEQGYTVVHLAISFLEWFESDDSDQPRRAPLILIPVELERVRAGDFSKVKWTGEDVFANISLAAKLVDQGVALPSFEAPEGKAGIDEWLQGVVDAIKKKARWRVLSEMNLDFFSFTKFVMFKDLDPSTWPDEKKAEDHPLLQSLFNPEGVPSNDDGFDEREIDKKLTARDLWHVRDADPSQIAVIEDVKAGRNLVVQGPPGTGKSQTIANLIAETLAAGKTVLFVSEKMAALEVVKSRLDEAGLGPFCLELHSRKANKKAVLLELQRALKSQALPPLSDAALDEHEVIKQELNRYAIELGTPIGELGLTPFQLYGERQKVQAHFEAAQRTIPLLPRIPDAARLTQAAVTAATTALRELVDTIPLVRPAAGHSWRHSALDAMLPHEEEEVRGALSEAQSTLQVVVEAAHDLGASSGAQTPTCISHVQRSLNAAEIVLHAGSGTETVLLLNPEWNTRNEIAERLVKDVEASQQERTELARTFTAAALDSELRRDIEELYTFARKPFRIFNRRYRLLRKELAASFSKEVPKTSQMIVDLVSLAEHQRSRETLRNDARGAALFGQRWSAEVSDVAELRRFAEWVVSFRRELVSDALTAQAVAIAASPIDAAAIALKIQRLRTSAQALRDQLDALVERVRFDPIAAFGRPLTENPFDQIAALLSMWTQKASDLFRWAQFNAARKAVRGTAAALMEPLIVDDRLADADVLPGFRLALSESLLRIAFGERASLGRFVGDLHEKRIARFRQIDRDLVKLNQARLSRRLHDRRPLVTGGASRNSEVGILLGEFNRKRAHMAIRKLLSQAGSLIQRIKPCFLMSPLSIAQFLHPQAARFDLIVFDEASQVRPEDAVGALLRGGQLVVMGDTQQLPPTSFFDTLASEIDESDEEDGPQSASVTDVESILHQCARSYPTKMLNWHYRSRHESLIAVSNLQFYDNQLHIYPSSIDQADEIGLHFVHIPQSVYDRGKSSTNRVEAKTVAMAAVDHYRRFPGKSLGVGAFNIKQQQAILEEIELQLKAHPEMEPFFKSDRPEHFFVKNLETIQGDERDVILISVGYGRDVAGKLSLNFGPINREGGERRLNVLMSRARERCVVFSNFTAGDLPLEGSASKGLQTLKMFLDYAQTRRLTIDNLSQEDTDSPFEDAVAEVLRQGGYEVRQQVGCAGFRVDLAVVDPKERGRYLIGIECDGAKYHSSPVARDRDRLRQQILEQLGWTIHRIWSTDWYRNRTETIEHLVGAVEVVMRAPRKILAESAESAPAYTSSFTADEYEEEYAVYDYTPTETVPDVYVELSPTFTPDASMVDETEEPASEAATGTKFDDIAPYEVCRSLRIPIVGELHELRPEALALAVEDVVLIEAPVMMSEVIRRIRTIWGLQRAGNRIREAIERGIHLAVVRGVVERDGDFLLIPNAPIRIRRRNGDPPAHIELISDREIAEAVKHTLTIQFATARTDLVNASSRRLGIQATTGGVAARVSEVIETGLANGWWRAQGDRIDLQR